MQPVVWCASACEKDSLAFVSLDLASGQTTLPSAGGPDNVHQRWWTLRCRRGAAGKTDLDGRREAIDLAADDRARSIGSAGSASPYVQRKLSLGLARRSQVSFKDGGGDSGNAFSAGRLCQGTPRCRDLHQSSTTKSKSIWRAGIECRSVVL